ncbi:aldo/keto reductase [Actinocorallia sp. B10E7]|uniref:aldo/keto reductase n=1 Tax=Actinocorallia sp. B10E7 TaxID=3153558 RepID=UPI00325D913F
MEYRRLGTSGAKVGAWGLGTMMFGASPDWRADEADRMIGIALEHGVNLVDTADAYAGGESERVLGKALKGRRDQVFLASKFHMPTGPGPNDRGNSRLHIMRAVEASLARLGTDHLDLYQVHRPDADCDLDETLGALTDLVRQGKVRYLGTSAFPPEMLVEAAWVAEKRLRERFVAEQTQYSVLSRAVESAVLPTCQRLGMGVIVWSPLAGGWLTGKYRRGAEFPAGSRAAENRVTIRFFSDSPENDRKYDLVEKLTELAAQAGLSLLQLALAWVDRHPAITSTLLGPRSAEQLSSLLENVGAELDDEVLDLIDLLVRPGTDVNPSDLGYVPPWLLDSSRRRRR